jgi:hypothetical protein
MRMQLHLPLHHPRRKKPNEAHFHQQHLHLRGYSALDNAQWAESVVPFVKSHTQR